MLGLSKLVKCFPCKCIINARLYSDRPPSQIVQIKNPSASEITLSLKQEPILKRWQLSCKMADEKNGSDNHIHSFRDPFKQKFVHLEEQQYKGYWSISAPDLHRYLFN